MGNMTFTFDKPRKIMKHLFFAILLTFTANISAHEVEKVVVIGAGAAGSSAAIFTGQSGLNPLVILNSDCNAHIALIHNIDNYPGIVDPIDGYDLLKNFRIQAEKFGARFVSETVEAVDVTHRPFKIELSNGDTVYSETLIVASGSTKRWLQLSDEQMLRGKGVVSSTFCKDTDYAGKHVIVVGGGHAALQEAIYISDVAASITIVNRGSKFSASQYHQNKAIYSNNIQIVYDTEVLAIEDISLDRVTGIRLLNSLTQEEYHLPADNVIIAIGSEPNSKLFGSQLEMTPSGNIVIKGNNTVTSVPGVFAAGDVTNTSYGRVVIAAGTGAMAAMDAARYLESTKE
jgi:thioredoxin reductase (NADPH)